MPDTSIPRLAAAFERAHRLDAELDLAVGRWGVRIESNSYELIDRLADYFRHFKCEVDVPTCVITAIECDEPDFGLEFLDWERDPGKTGRKDTYADIEGGRVLRKYRTGMQFLIGSETRLAVGPCLKNENQVINFVNSQYITWMLRQEAVLCHAAAVVQDGMGIAMAGFSGGGKSTLALHLLAHGLSYGSNDRLLVGLRDGRAIMSGVPKFPRINPGTALNNPHLHGVLPAQRRAELATIASEDLWDLEEKYDVEIDKVFDGVEFHIEAPLGAFIVLNWKRDHGSSVRFAEVDLAERRDLLAAIMKSPGPFYEPPDGSWPPGRIEVDEEQYLRTLAGVRVYEVSGGVDFAAATQHCLELVRG